jgi:hypothetical protein
MSESDCLGKDTFYESECVCKHIYPIIMIISASLGVMVVTIFLLEIKCKVLTKLLNHMCKTRNRNQRTLPTFINDNMVSNSPPIARTDSPPIMRTIPMDVPPEISNEFIAIQIHRDGKYT